MNFGTVFRAFDAMMALGEAARRFKGTPPATETTQAPIASSGIGGHLEARLTNVVVAALKEAFDRDHARLELERAQLDEERRRAEAALRMELRRQAADQELGRLRLLAATAFVGWIASVALLVARLGSVSTGSRAMMAAGWALLLGGLGASFTAQKRLSASVPDGDTVPGLTGASTAALWLVLAGLAATAASLLF